MNMDPGDRRSTQNLLADWRAAGRDAVAARAAANVAALALDAASAAEQAANEVETAARAALEAVDKARGAATMARDAATRAAEAAHLILAGAEQDKVKANRDVDMAEQAERDAGDAFHEGEAMVRADVLRKETEER